MEATGLHLANAFCRYPELAKHLLSISTCGREEITETQGANRVALQANWKATRGRDGN